MQIRQLDNCEEQAFLIWYLVGNVFCILTKSWKAKKILPKFILVYKN